MVICPKAIPASSPCKVILAWVATGHINICHLSNPTCLLDTLMYMEHGVMAWTKPCDKPGAPSHTVYGRIEVISLAAWHCGPRGFMALSAERGRCFKIRTGCKHIWHLFHVNNTSCTSTKRDEFIIPRCISGMLAATNIFFTKPLIGL